MGWGGSSEEPNADGAEATTGADETTGAEAVVDGSGGGGEGRGSRHA